MNARSAHLEVVAGLVEKHVPIYEPGQWDPVVAAETGHGSCFSKNVFGAIIIKHVTNNAVTAIQWGSKQHPKLPSGVMLDTDRIRPGHSALLVATGENPGRIVTLSFNEKLRRNDAWNIYDFNIQDDDPYASLVGSEIQATEEAEQLGINIYPWYQAGQKYTEALGINDSVFHTMTEQEIESIIFDNLRNEALERQIPNS
jgi:hypothetical protein